MIKKIKTLSNQELERREVKVLRRAGIGIRKTERVSGLSERTVYRLETRRAKRAPGSTGRKKLSRGQKISIRNTITNNPFLTPMDLINMLNLSCGRETVRQCLIKLGYKYRKQCRKEALDPEDEWQRVRFSLDWLNFGL